MNENLKQVDEQEMISFLAKLDNPDRRPVSEDDDAIASIAEALGYIKRYGADKFASLTIEGEIWLFNHS